ncbi:MAG: acyl-ACP--UDP-N-acetylglucosamine O-acyltransferase [Desulfovibrio sp.]|jgi:UDP-N-acetylglucosamine acyltransferase|nr:acyl-ACP--UDP-N-acetylglucosamine O-acyltransferase [Desulfovibrio sp.]
MGGFIHPSSFVSDKAELGEDVRVGPCAVIEEDVRIGDGCEIRAFASVLRYTQMGRGNIIHSYALVGGVPQDLKFAGEVSRLEIGDNNNIREFATLHRGTEGGGGITRIGDNNLIMAYSHVAHDCLLGNRIVMSNGATLAGHVQLADHVVIGGLSAVHQFARIGRNAFIGGMTGIPQDLPPYMMAVGERAGIQGPNLVGLRRLKLPSRSITAIRAAFRLIWLSNVPRREALDKAEADYAQVPEVLEIVNFVRESPRGVLSASRNAADPKDE